MEWNGVEWKSFQNYGSLHRVCFWRPEPSCSRLTLSVVDKKLNFQMSYKCKKMYKCKNTAIFC